MLSTRHVDEIVRLLREGKLSQRKIVHRLGISRGTVSAIASGRRGLFGKSAEIDEERAHRSSSPPARCPACGYRVYMPCLVCRARRRQHERQLVAAIARLSGRFSPPNGVLSRARRVLEAGCCNEYF